MSKPVMTKMRPPGGFTLMELVMAIILVGILSAVVLTNFNAKAQHNVAVQADIFRRNLSHIQLLAISQSQRLKLSVGSGGYTVCTASTATCDSTHAITDPTMAGGSFFVNTTDPDGVIFTQGIGDYFFDSLGRPVLAATGSTLKFDTSTYTLNGSNNCVDVSVLPITGFAITAHPRAC